MPYLILVADEFGISELGVSENLSDNAWLDMTKEKAEEAFGWIEPDEET